MWLCIVILDIDECAVANGGCEHNCINTERSFYCDCRDGFVLEDDGRQCRGNKMYSNTGSYTVEGMLGEFTLLAAV